MKARTKTLTERVRQILLARSDAALARLIDGWLACVAMDADQLEFSEEVQCALGYTIASATGARYESWGAFCLAEPDHACGHPVPPDPPTLRLRLAALSVDACYHLAGMAYRASKDAHAWGEPPSLGSDGYQFMEGLAEFIDREWHANQSHALATGGEQSWTSGDWRFSLLPQGNSRDGWQQCSVLAAPKEQAVDLSLMLFPVSEVIRAITEPSLRAQWAERLAESIATATPSIDEEIAVLVAPYRNPRGTFATPPKGVRSRWKALRQQRERAIARVEKEGMHAMLAMLDLAYFDKQALQSCVTSFAPARFLRTFYYSEMAEENMRAFCDEYAQDASYRQSIATGNAPWMMRDMLFTRNINRRPWQGIWAGSDEADHDYLSRGVTPVRRREFFRWICQHAGAILTLPEAQPILQHDSNVPTAEDDIDDDLSTAVDAWESIPGVTISFANRGVSGVVRYEEMDLLISPCYSEHAFMTFCALPPPICRTLREQLRAFPHLVFEDEDLASPRLRTCQACDNARFPQDAWQIAVDVAHERLPPS